MRSYSNPFYTESYVLPTEFDAVIRRNGVILAAHSYKGPGPDELGRADLIRNYLDWVKNGDRIELAPRLYNFGQELLTIPYGVSFDGADQFQTVFKSEYGGSAASTAFDLLGANRFQDMTFIHQRPLPIPWQGQCIGWASERSPMNTWAEWYRCSIIGYGGFALYSAWGGGNFAYAKDCAIAGGRWVVCGMLSSEAKVAGLNCQRFELDDCHVVADYGKYGGGGGDQGQTTIAVIMRGGQAVVRNSVLEATGFAGTGDGGPNSAPFDLVACMSTSNIGGHGSIWGQGRWPYIRGESNHYIMRLNGAKAGYDLLQSIGKLEDITPYGQPASVGSGTGDNVTLRV